jgi:hypothetical protein
VGAFEQYQKSSAWVWEHQALTRARYCAGDAAIGEAFERARDDGISLLVIEQFTARALAFCERAYILRRGTVVWEGDADAAGEEVAEQYLGAGAA